MSVSESSKIIAAKALVTALQRFEAASNASTQSDFGDIGVSDEFASTALNPGELSRVQTADIVKAIHEAADSRDMRTVTEILGVVGQFLGPLRAILRLGA